MYAKPTQLFIVASFLACTGFASNVGAQGFAAGPAAATVNGEKISAADVDKLLKRDTPPVHPLTQKQKLEMWELAVDMLVNDTLMRQFLAKNTPPVSAAQLGKEMDQLKEALSKQKPPITLQQFLKESDQTEAELKEEMTVRVQWRAYVTQRLPDPMVKKYYDANKVFFDKVFVRASHILLKVPEKATELQKQAVKQQLVQIRADILAGKISFDEAAKKYSDCPSGKQKGQDGKDKCGDIGHFPYKFAVAEPFAAMAFNMKVGDISDLIETEFGFHIIKVTDRTAGTASKFEDIVDLVRDVYSQDLQLFQSIITEQRQKSKIELFPPK